MSPAILCCDPGFAEFGVAVIRLHASGEHVLKLDVIRTQKDNKKRNTLQAEDNLRRTREIFRALRANVGEFEVSAIAIEAESAMRNASSAAKVSKGHAAIACIAEMYELPIVQASPQRIRKTLCGNMRATDDEIESALLVRYGNDVVNLFDKPKTPRVPEGLWKHGWDALAAGVCCLDSDVLRAIRQMARVA